MKPLHPWDVDVEEAKQIQEKLRSRVILKKTFRTVERIGGADVTYSRTDPDLLGVIIVFSFSELRILDTAVASAKSAFPYVPGLLSFREGPVLIEAFNQLKIKPNVMIFEGQGIWHPREFGLASHLGLWLDIPSVGCTKEPLTHAPITVEAQRGHHQKIWRNQKEIGAVVRTKEGVKPVFVSPGHRIDLPTSIELVLDSCRNFRIPEPLRQSDHLGRLYMREAAKIR